MYGRESLEVILVDVLGRRGLDLQALEIRRKQGLVSDVRAEHVLLPLHQDLVELSEFFENFSFDCILGLLLSEEDLLAALKVMVQVFLVLFEGGFEEFQVSFSLIVVGLSCTR